MNQVTLAFVWGLGIGTITGLCIGVFIGRAFQMWSSSRDEYAKRNREFDEQDARIRKSIDERRDKPL